MKNLIALSTAASIAIAAAPALADDHATMDDGSTKAEGKVTVVSTNDDGKATQVRIDGKVYDVCMNAEQDNCINPRAAGLDWGNVPLNYWPGQPASSM